MNLIKEINEALETQIKTETEFFESMREKIDTLFESSLHSELFETADAFLSQVAAVIRNGTKLTPDQAKIMAAKLAALQLLADAGTRGAALSVIVGSDSNKKLAIIMKQTSGADQPLGQVDKVLVGLAGKVGKTGVTNNTEMLSGLEGMDEKAHNAKSAEIMKLSNTFKQLETNMQQQSNAPAPMPTAPTGV